MKKEVILPRNTLCWHSISANMLHVQRTWRYDDNTKNIERIKKNRYLELFINIVKLLKESTSFRCAELKHKVQ